MSFNETPNAVRLHIGIFGKRNSGKSTLLNTITGQKISTVSPIAGTTTDPVIKAMELHGLGPVVFYDTAGFDDEGELGALRVEKTKEIIQKTDMAILVFRDPDISWEMEWYDALKEKKIPVLCIWNKDNRDRAQVEKSLQQIKHKIGNDVLVLDAARDQITETIRQALIRLLPCELTQETITGHLVSPHDLVLLVMPQDIQAPKGRLILPQVQTIRDLLDHKCIVQSCTSDTLDAALSTLAKPPKLIITDSQVFPLVYEKKPKESLLTSFSVLFAKYKGDIQYFIESAKAIDTLHSNSRVLIAEACTHAPLTEDIGRVKIPAMLKKRYGDGLQIEIVSGTDFPKDVKKYDLIIHCGACMFNKKYVLSRVEQAKQEGVPMTNYGIAIAYIKKILDHITY
ncbi:[FeFe] hydrogenase H-cluster maturation GTPase HydF [Erysipelotrichaceae bacterium AF15-26LB]|nr:hydrogenase maturation GTPase HydF [Erysipelotrichaceae bacterium 3_1_53]MCR0348050.1 [FeFe] hydrogenase H-cluster maturation GTPase HydF [[Clostridium] innocuum]RJV88013.1 [FeFe] hydrogenase H-cluster maturation GTPase HydF [Erysipelotrichaceae bacterium AF15-26LB]RJV89794.1 [FeFe] hydrogenase H-cluster maturation GTPase HydF [Erysipelotrichaceae bacterium AF19-24AC]